jgi:hypothetical protein
MGLFAGAPSLQTQHLAGTMMAGAQDLGAGPMDIRLSHPAIAQWLQQAQQMQQRSHSPVKVSILFISASAEKLPGSML